MLGNIAEVPETHNTDCPVWCSQAPKILHNLIRHLIKGVAEWESQTAGRGGVLPEAGKKIMTHVKVT
jgi:hypothetical protein